MNATRSVISGLTALAAAMLFGTAAAHAQGCVAIRSTGSTACLMTGAEDDYQPAWVVSANNRYFRSFRHFVGRKEQAQRLEQETEVVNHSYTTDLYLQRRLGPRWSVALDVPVIRNTRSSLYEHGGNAAGPAGRHMTQSFGIGDLRVTAYGWLRQPGHGLRWNVQAGLGLKLPTGDYRYQDYFVRNDSTRVLGPVDQSIQLGDGGTGFTVELNGHAALAPRLAAYGTFYYLVNPRTHNGVSTARGGPPSATAALYRSDVMSVPDQVMLRLGGTCVFGRLSASLGGRYEAIPVHDLIGGSEGFRRPGYVISAEPGLSWRLAPGSTVHLTVPWALVRDRTQSVPDKIRTEITGTYSQGDAAFADYSVLLGVSLGL